MKAVQLLIVLFFLSVHCLAQDTTKKVKVVTTPIDTVIVSKDSLVKKKHSPRIATRRSLILPGWGQAYNKEYWKIPIVYAFLGTTAGIWIYNNTWYKRTRFAYSLVVDTLTARYNEIHPKLINNGQPLDAEALQFYRNSFRRDRDYSTLYFFLFWGLNVADATVFAHLKNFDVSNDLSLKARPTFNPSTKSTGVSLVFSFKDRSSNSR